METDLATIDEEQVAELLDRSVNDLRTLDGVQAKLEAGAQVADVGCGHGASTLIMAQAYSNSVFGGRQ
jgi:cyclopropane fatty-acyl-phospholipid synthase-like methyltransferase